MSADKYPGMFSRQMEAIVYLYAWFDSCEDGRLTQSRSSDVIHGWPGVKNTSAAPNKISST